MRRAATVTIVSGALAAGLFAAGPAAEAATGSKVQQAAAQEGPGSDIDITQEGAISPAALIAEAQRSGKPFSAKDTAAIKAAKQCGWYKRTRGRKYNGRVAFYVSNRLDWCWDGTHVVSYKASFKAYTRNKNVWKWRGWVKKSAVHDSGWTYAKSTVQGAFYSTINHKTYKPWATVTGYKNGKYRWKVGG